MMDRTNGFRFRLPSLVLVAALAGCQWPMDAVPMIPLQFQGQVLSHTRAPVAGAEVQVWVDRLERAEGSTPFVAGRTDADGRFLLERSVRNRVPPSLLTLRVTPPAASGLATRTLSGEYSGVFSDFEKVGSRSYRFSTEVVLERAP